VGVTGAVAATVVETGERGDMGTDTEGVEAGDTEKDREVGDIGVETTGITAAGEEEATIEDPRRITTVEKGNSRDTRAKRREEGQRETTTQSRPKTKEQPEILEDHCQRKVSNKPPNNMIATRKLKK